jgi:endonuclease YncB( thermonuclease family)
MNSNSKYSSKPNYKKFLKPWIVSLASVTGLSGLLVGVNPDLQKAIGIPQSTNSKTSSYSKKKTTFNKAPEGIESAKIMRVVDGDTVELEDGRRVRLLNLDTPETVKPNTPVKCYGKEASDFSKKYLTDKVVQLVADKEANDKYGRALRMIYLEGKDTSKPEESFNAELIRNGFGKVVVYNPNKTFEKPLRQLEQEAKDKNIGVWSCPNPFVE